MEMLSEFAYPAFLILAMIWFTTEVLVLSKRRIRRQFLEIPGFTPQKVHLGFHSGLAFDFTRQKFAYSNGRIAVPFSVLEIDDAGHAWDITVDEHGNTTQKNHNIAIITNNYDWTEINVPFWFKYQAQRCRISISNLLYGEIPQEVLDHFNEPPNTESPNSKSVEPSLKDSQSPETNSPKNSVLNISSDEQELADKLSEFLTGKGFSREDGIKEKKKKKVRAALALLNSDFKKVCACSSSQVGEQKIAARALESFFLPNSDDPENFGYASGTLKIYVSQYTSLGSNKE